jgi:adenylate kinase family enzyme
MQRIVVVGTTGSGKTMLARELAKRLGIPYVELDALYWEPQWTEPTVEVFRERVSRAVSGEAWVVDGNYSKVRDLVWPRADTVVWVDFSLPVILQPLVRRTFQRVVTQEELWSGNRERLRTALFSRNSLFVWALKTYRRRRREYSALPRMSEFAHLTIVRLRSPRAAEMWLSAVSVENSTSVGL